jgi:hypothetical protein
MIDWRKIFEESREPLEKWEDELDQAILKLADADWHPIGYRFAP